MCPPSSGSSGTKLNMPMKKLKPAISMSRNTVLSATGKPSRETVSPARRPPPTMLTGLSIARSLTPTMASATPQTLTGRVLSATTVSLVIVPIWSSV